LLVKSFESSTRAFAGSHAAQHSVSCFVWATAWPPKHEAKATAITPNARIIWIITTSLLQAIACLPCQSHPPFDGHARRLISRPYLTPAGTMFSIVVKLKSFTKHISSQWTLQNLLKERSCCCTATVRSTHPAAKNKDSWESAFV
jgi:hypothetical protein